MSSQLNYPLLSIPAYYLFSTIPHFYASCLLKASGYTVNNANPKSSLAPPSTQGKLPKAIFERFQRAECAQGNNMEQLPLFATAVLGSILAEKFNGGETGLMAFIGMWFAIRTVYCLLYVYVEDHSLSFARSASWAVGTGLVGWQVWKAASLLGELIGMGLQRW